MIITTFAAGELSDTLKGRTDIQQYYQGCSRLENFDVIPTGGIKRRTGFERLGKLSGECRIIPFILDKDNSFILEFIPNKIKIWKNGQPLLASSGVQITIDTSYVSLSEIKEIQFAQNYNTMIFVQRNYKPFQIEYDFATETFKYGDMNFNFYPEVNIDDDYGYIKIAEEQLPTEGKQGEYCLFQGILYQWFDGYGWIETKGEGEFDKGLFIDEDKRPGSVAFYNNRLWFASSYQGRQKVWASRTPDTEKTRYNDFSTYNRFISVNKVIKDPDLHLFTADILTSNISGGQTKLTNVTQDLTNALQQNATMYFCSGKDIPIGSKIVSISPDTIIIDKEVKITEDQKAQVYTIQLWRNPQTPSAEDYEYQIADNSITTSDCSFFFEIASDQNDAIKWIAANKQMVIGTESSLWYVPQGVNALQVYADLNGRYGSDDIQARPVGNAVIFFAQGRKAIREAYYTQENAFTTNNIAILAEHLLRESPITDFTFMTNPYNRIIANRADGRLVTLLYDKNNGVMAWGRIKHGSLLITSSAVTRGEDEADYLYCVVKDKDNYYLERMDETKKVYLDSWKLYQNDITEYTEMAILYNDTTKESCRVTNIPENFINSGDTVYIGYTFCSTIKSLPVVNGNPDNKKRITNLLIRFDNSYMPYINCGELPDEFIDVQEPFSGIQKVVYPGNSSRDVTFTVVIEKPEECKILTVNAELA